MPLDTWPPVLRELKIDAGTDEDDTRDDPIDEQDLAAAVSFVERIHAETFDFSGTSDDPDLEPVDAALVLGTIRLAQRWKARRKSFDALVSMGDMGASRVPSFDVDIDRMLRIGRFAPAAFA